MLFRSNRDNTSNWIVWHSSLAAGNYYMLLQQTDGQQSGVNFYPNSTTFGFGHSASERWITYLWTAIPGYSAFGSYTGNGSSDGTFVYTGFRPRYILQKCSSQASSWIIWDTTRSTYNVLSNADLLTNSSAAEGGGSWGTAIDILSNGFKFRNADSYAFNASNQTYIYAAFAEIPFKYARAR